MTEQEQAALKTLVEWKRNSDALVDFVKSREGQDLTLADEEKRKFLIMEAHKANLVLQAVAAELVESYVKSASNPKVVGEIRA